MGTDSGHGQGNGRALPKAAKITIFGGSGFVGRYVVQTLAQRGYRIRVAVRRPNDAMFLRPMGVVGQVEPIQANIRDEASVRDAVAGADCVINLVGILHESGKQTFKAVHVDGAARIAQAARDAGVASFVQVSAIGADPESDSAYASSKGEGEKAVLDAFPGATIIRPSVLFGPDDGFFNRFAAMARLSPVLPLIGGGDTRLQPVYARDVAEGLARILERDGMAGRIYEFGGPDVQTLRELTEMTLRIVRRRRILLPVPSFAAKAMAYFTQYIPNPPLTPDQVRLLAVDNVVSDEAKAEARTLEGLGLHPTSAEVVLPTYLYMFRRAGQFERVNAG